MSVLNSILAPIFDVYIKQKSKRRLPQTDGTLSIHGLEDTVRVQRDKWGVAYISATTDTDLIFAQGFVHAQDRLWQMELNRRTAIGSLSEVFGEVTLDTDKMNRILGFRRLAEQDLEDLDDDSMQAIRSYVKGVNAFINHFERKFPIEFSLVKLTPEPWTPTHCLAVSRMMIWRLSTGWYSELVRTQLTEAVGEEHAKDLEIQYSEDNPIEIPAGIEFNKLVKGKLKKVDGPFLERSMGSNAWVVAGNKTPTGKPILANDMHLSMSLPGIWYHNHLRSKDTEVSGVSIPGLPAVLVGHNRNIAWGATLSYIDCEDLFIEKFDPEQEDMYEFKGKPKQATVLREIIEVKGKLNVQIKIVVTEHGPIISEFLEDITEPISLQSTALQPSQAMKGWFLLNKAANWDDFVEGVRHISAPTLNIVFADNENIGIFCSGKIPIRKKGDGRLPVPGWSGDYEWKGYIPFEEMPHSLNPEKGYIISCNNRIADKDYKHNLGHNFMNGFRAKQLETYFEKHETIDMELSKQMQMDFTCLPAQQVMRHFESISITDPNPKVAEAFKMMKEWDFQLTTDTIGGTLYEVTRFMMVRHLFSPHLGNKLTETYSGIGFHPVLYPSHEFYGHDTVAILRILEQEDSWWLDHAGGKEKFLTRSFKSAFEWLMDNRGLDMTGWTWGEVHKITFEHPLSLQPPLDKVFNLGPYPVGGNTDTPCQMAVLPNSHFFVTAWAPSWRQIVDLSDITKSIAVHAPGQSGQVSSPHYHDLVPLWIKGEYYPMLWTRGQIESSQLGQLKLEPKFQSV